MAFGAGDDANVAFGHFSKGIPGANADAPTGEAMFLFRVANHAHIEQVFGIDIVQRTIAAASDYLAAMVSTDGIVTLHCYDTIGIRITQGIILGDGLDDQRCNAWMRLVCETLPLISFGSEEEPIHLWLSGFWAVPGRHHGKTGHSWTFPYFCPIQELPGWRELYRADMVNVSQALAALRSFNDEGEDAATALQPFWQKINSVHFGTPQFFEALARIPAVDGRPVPTMKCVLSLERTGFVRLLDLHMVRRVIAELERSSDIQVAVNLSALSIYDDAWWEDVRAVLQDKHSIASRLFLELTETAPFPEFSEAVRFVDTMRKLGCKIVLDDFGAGHTAVRQLFAMAPDIVKIASPFLQRATLSDRDRNIFSCLVSLAGSGGAAVVAEGVETAHHKRIAIEAGVDWLQGFLWGNVFDSPPGSHGRQGANLQMATGT